MELTSENGIRCHKTIKRKIIKSSYRRHMREKKGLSQDWIYFVSVHGTHSRNPSTGYLVLFFFFGVLINSCIGWQRETLFHDSRMWPWSPWQKFWQQFSLYPVTFPFIFVTFQEDGKILTEKELSRKWTKDVLRLIKGLKDVSTKTRTNE